MRPPRPFALVALALLLAAPHTATALATFERWSATGSFVWSEQAFDFGFFEVPAGTCRSPGVFEFTYDAQTGHAEYVASAAATTREPVTTFCANYLAYGDNAVPEVRDPVLGCSLQYVNTFHRYGPDAIGFYARSRCADGQTDERWTHVARSGATGTFWHGLWEDGIFVREWRADLAFVG